MSVWMLKQHLPRPKEPRQRTISRQTFFTCFCENIFFPWRPQPPPANVRIMGKIRRFLILSFFLWSFWSSRFSCLSSPGREGASEFRFLFRMWWVVLANSITFPPYHVRFWRTPNGGHVIGVHAKKIFISQIALLQESTNHLDENMYVCNTSR